MPFQQQTALAAAVAAQSILWLSWWPQLACQCRQGTPAIKNLGTLWLGSAARLSIACRLPRGAARESHSK